MNKVTYDVFINTYKLYYVNQYGVIKGINGYDQTTTIKSRMGYFDLYYLIIGDLNSTTDSVNADIFK